MDRAPTRQRRRASGTLIAQPHRQRRFKTSASGTQVAVPGDGLLVLAGSKHLIGVRPALFTVLSEVLKARAGACRIPMSVRTLPLAPTYRACCGGSNAASLNFTPFSRVHVSMPSSPLVLRLPGTRASPTGTMTPRVQCAMAARGRILPSIGLNVFMSGLD